MSRISTLQRAMLLLAAILTTSIYSLLPGLAAAATSAAPNPGQGLQLSPPVISAQANPGQSVTLNIKLRNVSGGTLIINGTANDFTAEGENGQPQISLNQTTPTRFSLRQWVGAIPSVSLTSQEQRVFPVQIFVPKNAEPGGHYAVIRFTGTPLDLKASGVALSASIGALILFTVNGAATHQLSTIDMRTQDSKGQTRSFFDGGPITILERIKDKGNVHEDPTGSIVVTDMFGKVTATLPFNDKKGNILPDSIRKFTQTLNQKPLFGHYTVTGNITYAGGTKLTLPATSFWVIPFKLLLGIVIALILLFLFFRVGIKRYNTRIIARSRRRS